MFMKTTVLDRYGWQIRTTLDLGVGLFSGAPRLKILFPTMTWSISSSISSQLDEIERSCLKA